MLQNKYSAKLAEHRHLRSNKEKLQKLEQLNIELNNLYTNLSNKGHLDGFEKITEKLNIYVQHTTILDLKFVTNLQNYELAMLQIFALDYLATQLNEVTFLDELKTHQEEFLALMPFSQEHYENRKQSFLQAISE